MSEELDDETLMRAKLNRETALIAWSELAVHFARGVVVKVGPTLSLLDVATEMSLDRRNTVASWLNTGDIAKASDADARRWHEAQPMLWCVVAAPWVLVQEKPGTSRGEHVH